MPPSPRTQVAIAIVEKDDRVLIGRRPENVPLAGYWEFPGGKVLAGETPAEAAVRECLEETGLPVAVVAAVAVEQADYDHGRLDLRFFHCRLTGGSAKPKAPFRWVLRGELPQYTFPPANAAVLRWLLKAGPSKPSE